MPSRRTSVTRRRWLGSSRRPRHASARRMDWSNCAGVAIDHLLATMREDAIDDMVATNLVGTVRLTRLVVRRMLPQRQGSIVTISSIVGLRGYRGLAVYSATKAGLDGMTRALGSWAPGRSG